MELLNLNSKITIRIYYEDTDLGGVVYHSRYLNFAERARAEFLRKLSLEQIKIKTKYDIQFIVKELKINYLGFCSLDDKIELETKLEAIDRVKLSFNHTFYKNNIEITKMFVKICCIKNTGKVARMPKDLYDKITIKG